MKCIIRLFFLISSCLYADVSHWQGEMVRSYVHHSDLQRRWAWSFLALYLKEVQADAKILDVGCGDGKITADISKFIPKGSILGIDLSDSMLDWAKRQYHPLEYPNLSFKEGSFTEAKVCDQFDWIVSFCALHHCSNQKEALHEISKALKPNGKLLILVPKPNNGTWKEACKRVQSRSKWACYWENFVPRKFLTVQEYENLFNELELRIVKIEENCTMDPFIDQREMLDWLEGTLKPVVPNDQAREFYQDWIEEYLRLDPQSIDENGTIYPRFGFIGIEASK